MKITGKILRDLRADLKGEPRGADGDWLDKAATLKSIAPLYPELTEADILSVMCPKTAAVEDSDDLHLVSCPDAPGYQTDQWVRVWANKIRGRKAGPLTPRYYWYMKKNGKKQFVYGYRLSLEGEQVFRTADFFAKQRRGVLNAERQNELERG
jgi:hypothetical protein